MSEIASYRGRVVTAADVEFIRQLIAAHPRSSRRALSHKLCEAWDWRQRNGQPRDVVCRGLLLRLDRAGLIELPPPRWRSRHAPVRRAGADVADVDRSPIHGDLRSLAPLRFEQVRRSACESLFHSLIQQHHYLGYTQPVGAHLKYLVFAQQRPVACLAWCSAPRHLGCRDRFLGWSPETRRRNIHLIAYNQRFLILPWVHVPQLASHVLGHMARTLSADWQSVYGHPLYYVETFVDPERFRGTCYRAANWIVVGRTTGRGKADRTHRPNRPVKDVLGYPLCRRFRECLCRAQSPAT